MFKREYVEQDLSLHKFCENTNFIFQQILPFSIGKNMELLMRKFQIDKFLKGGLFK